MKPLNQTQISFTSNSVNESFGRAVVAAFLAQLDPTVADLTDMKTAVSEAVTNAIVHGYRDKLGIVYITVKIFENGKSCGPECATRVAVSRTSRRPWSLCTLLEERNGPDLALR